MVYPCLDEHRRYRSFPCSECLAPRCVFGRKPAKPEPELAPGQRRCNHCGTPFYATGRTLYCDETCRYRAMMKRRRVRRLSRAGA